MRDLSLHILDVAENSIEAGAKNISVLLEENTEKDLLILEITDDGKGMSEELIAKADDPFTTSRKTRRVGLGLPLLKAAARLAGGEFKIVSTVGKGTIIRATFQLSNVDRKPIGNIKDTIITLIIGNPDINFIFVYKVEGNDFTIDTREMRHVTGFKDTLKITSLLKKELKENFTI
jgi:anti-sigma regulatory factor (Ser/Thr protein kinase)